MAKALVGYVGGIDPRKARETWRLRQRIIDLESEVRRLKEENDALVAVHHPAPEHPGALVDELADLEPAERVLEPVVR
ncbi:MAG: hypothetical protein H0V23_06990 [Nocardioidaceae bacterium]|nr:hypothetical protein [Nocardioidaceae bacterium]